MTPQAEAASRAFYETLSEKGCRVDAAQLTLAWERAAEAARTGAAVYACSVCAKPFIPVRSDRKYCTDRCRQAAYRHRLARIGKVIK